MAFFGKCLILGVVGVIGWAVWERLSWVSIRYMWLMRLRKGETYQFARFFGVAIVCGLALKWLFDVGPSAALVGSLCLAFLWLVWRALSRMLGRLETIEECLRNESAYKSLKAEHRLAKGILGAIRDKQITKGMTCEEIVSVVRAMGIEIEPGAEPPSLYSRIWSPRKGYGRREFTAYFDNDRGSFQLEFKDGKLVDWDGGSANPWYHPLSQPQKS